MYMTLYMISGKKLEKFFYSNLFLGVYMGSLNYANLPPRFLSHLNPSFLVFYNFHSSLLQFLSYIKFNNEIWNRQPSISITMKPHSYNFYKISTSFLRPQTLPPRFLKTPTSPPRFPRFLPMYTHIYIISFLFRRGTLLSWGKYYCFYLESCFPLKFFQIQMNVKIGPCDFLGS